MMLPRHTEPVPATDAMLKRSIIALALLAYLAVLGCALLPTRGQGPTTGFGTASRPAVNLEGLPYRGAVIQLQRTDWIDRYKKSIDEIADLGADTVSFLVDARQENGSSSVIYLDLRFTPSVDALASLIGHAKQRKLRVVLMPIVLLDRPRHDRNEWRGTISPDNWGAWFESYRAMMRHYAWIAEANGVDLLVVGSELVSSQDKVAEWRAVIREVRSIYRGRLTYSSNWDVYTRVQFWDDLDLIGMNSYWKLGDDRNVPTDEIVRRWQKIQADLLPWVREQGKPLILLEAGWCSMSNAAHEPWDYTREDPIDLDLQKRLYEGFFRAWHGNPDMGGYMMWDWPPSPGGPEDRSYTPKNKPAEKVLREWIVKPWKASE